jgi:type IV pilus assembly protein PilV
MRLQNPTNCRGVGLLEVLISVLVLGIGLLGIAALQTQALKTSADAQYFQLASVLANDYLERARANRVALTEYAFSRQTPACTPPTLSGSVAARDKALWLQQVACQLPDASAEISLADRNMQITISWFDRTSTEQLTGRDKQFQITSQF